MPIYFVDFLAVSAHAKIERPFGPPVAVKGKFLGPALFARKGLPVALSAFLSPGCRGVSGNTPAAHLQHFQVLAAKRLPGAAQRFTFSITPEITLSIFGFWLPTAPRK